MMMQDKLEKERNDAKNAVEEYVYDFRDKLCGVFEKFITEEVRIACVSTAVKKKCLCTCKFSAWVMRLQGSLKCILEYEID